MSSNPPRFLIAEPVEDFEYEGRIIPASRLGYRITKRFVHFFFCRIFDNPAGVFTGDMLQPETQDLGVFVDGIENIVQAMEKSAQLYFDDGIIEDACPPLRAVLHVMAHGHYNGRSIKDPEIRAMFSRDYLIHSNWYKARLVKKQKREINLWTRHVKYLQEWVDRPGYEVEANRLSIFHRLEEAKKQLVYVGSDQYIKSLVGTLGADPIHDGYDLVQVNGIATDIKA
jgi:hypothetical protein